MRPAKHFKQVVPACGYPCHAATVFARAPPARDRLALLEPLLVLAVPVVLEHHHKLTSRVLDRFEFRGVPL